VAHVADGIDVDEEADAGDDEDHDARKRIEEEAPVGDESGWRGRGSFAWAGVSHSNMICWATRFSAEAASNWSTAPAAWMKDRPTLPTQKTLTAEVRQAG